MKKILALLIILLSMSCSAQRGSFRNMVETNGKIGIGTRSPDEMLTVKGKIHTQEVLVDLNGAVAPDYVFDRYYDGMAFQKKDYQFKSLDEIENYIALHRHLPGVPSAKEIETDGLSLKAMNLILLEKIEELTLHTIEQQKQLDIMKEKIWKLENPAEKE